MKKSGSLQGLKSTSRLDTREKLFCRCPTLLRRTEEHSGEYHRYLRATESEMGEIDDAAREEMKRERILSRMVLENRNGSCSTIPIWLRDTRVSSHAVPPHPG